MSYYLNSKVRHIHFIGIGGAGMSGIAEILKARGYFISGSDTNKNDRIIYLEKLGIPITLGHTHSTIITRSDLIIYSSAIAQDNPELTTGRDNGTPSISRGHALAELMHGYYGIAVAGSHGKTNVTGLISHLFLQHELDPTIVIGGHLNCIDSHARFGKSRYLITEADESDASFLLLEPKLGVITNIDKDHLQAYGGDFNQLIHAFYRFGEQCLNGLVIFYENEILRAMVNRFSSPVITYGFDKKAMVRGVQMRQVGQQLYFKVERDYLNRPPLSIKTRLSGYHSVLNILAAVSISSLLNLPEHFLSKAFHQYTGIKRRFELLGEVTIQGKKLAIIDDYGHHPREITVTVQAIRDTWPSRRLIMVFQPHRYTRTRDLLDEFVQVLAHMLDYLILLPIYTAGEVIIPDISTTLLAQLIQKTGKLKPIVINPDQLIMQLYQVVADNDIVLFQGAGDISQMAHAFLHGQECV